MTPDDLIPSASHRRCARIDLPRFLQGRRREDLDKDQMLVFALVHALQIVGEAANKMSAEARNELPQVPWALIVGMRHRLVHAYFDIDLNILWTTATEASSALLAQIKPVLDPGDVS